MVVLDMSLRNRPRHSTLGVISTAFRLRRKVNGKCLLLPPAKPSDELQTWLPHAAPSRLRASDCRVAFHPNSVLNSRQKRGGLEIPPPNLPLTLWRLFCVKQSVQVDLNFLLRTVEGCALPHTRFLFDARRLSCRLRSEGSLYILYAALENSRPRRQV
jgi:hypothetical protein